MGRGGSCNNPQTIKADASGLACPVFSIRPPHHVTQRGNGRERTFFGDEDLAHYFDLLADAAERAGAEVWCYCLKPNHVHIIIVPSAKDGLRRTFADTHRRYKGYINARHRWTGHLWQGRSGAVAIDAAPGGGGALCLAQSGAGEACCTSAGLALVERAGAYRRTGRSRGQVAPALERAAPRRRLQLRRRWGGTLGPGSIFTLDPLNSRTTDPVFLGQSAKRHALVPSRANGVLLFQSQTGGAPQ